MRSLWVIGVAAALPAAVGACALVTGAAPVDARSPASAAITGAPAAADGIRDLIALVEGARRSHGCRGALIWDERVAGVARAHAHDMADNEYFSHRDALGRDVLDRLEAARIPVRAAAENLVMAADSAREAFEDWRASPRHARNMTNCRYTHHGIGMTDGYWAHVLIRPAPARLR